MDMFKNRKKSGKINIKSLTGSVYLVMGLCRIDEGGYKERILTV